MKYLLLTGALGLLFTNSLQAQNKTINAAEVSRIVKTLSADDMQGRKAFTPGNDKAADFIQAEFKKAGLQNFPGLTSFEQKFNVYQVTTEQSAVVLDGQPLAHEAFFIQTCAENLNWNQNNPALANISRIEAQDNLSQKFQEALAGKKSGLVLIDPAHAEMFKRYQNYLGNNNMHLNLDSTTIVFALTTNKNPKNVQVTAQNKITPKSLRNVVGYLPGKSRPKEFVIFSAHYDHIGILPAVNGDSIANGADDDASGTTAVIALARYFKKLNNARSLLFVTFTAEEIGGYGAQYFTKQLNPEQITAMFNIEMIGKESQFGKNAGFITGFDKSDFGAIVQKNLAGSKFAFHPDPYIKENLFYRSDNAALARLGVPAHTLSTDKIDTDKLYHTVDDEFASLNISNMTSIIEAIAQGARSIIAGKDTPTRIQPQDVK
ncbi:M20/M25/M40 family metallo-hydrolase [Adhaeribacter swui]|uniref:M20/M25/M40 family metallo-hydrolase n=1 Tax=Adhaeribacter swui TaxID=2086471 RepID=A0A7G7GAH6_9BACT|nr:M20/M25/M40 family metallo-hydrolase [Adhaeribacter swui]QNF34160.1 M20/M25/M40 family metallo-hydrolase [Adhaeribacter swui]